MKEEELDPFLSDKQPNNRITILYDRYREEFISFVRKYYTIADEDIFDVYQNSFIIIWEKIRNGELTVEQYPKVSLKTYLLSVGINLVKNHLRKYKFSAESLPERPPDSESKLDNLMETKELQKIILREIRALGEPCNQILSLFYFARKSLKEIAEVVGYKNEQVAKSKRFSCMELLTKRIKQKYNKDDFFYE